MIRHNWNVSRRHMKKIKIAYAQILADNFDQILETKDNVAQKPKIKI